MRILKIKDWLRLQKEKEKLKIYESRFEELKAEHEYIKKKWETSGLLDGLKGMVKSNIAQLLESQASAMIPVLDIQPVPDTFKTKEQ